LKKLSRGTLVLGITYWTQSGADDNFRMTAVGASQDSRQKAEQWFDKYRKDGGYRDISRAYKRMGRSRIYRIDSYGDVPRSRQEDSPDKT